MNIQKLSSLQAPLNARYREEPEAARITLKVTDRIDDDNIACKVDTARVKQKGQTRLKTTNK